MSEPMIDPAEGSGRNRPDGQQWPEPGTDSAFAAPRPTRAPTTEDQLTAATVGTLEVLDGPISLAPYDPAWPALFDIEERRIRDALGSDALLVEHVGSTSVPRLAAKPIIDIVLAVRDAADEPDYLPRLEARGYRLRIREPEWHQHRMLRGPGTAVNLHVFPSGCPEVDRMLAFRDRLRCDAFDRALYDQVKRDLAARHWTYVQSYADAKSAVVEEILARSPGADPEGTR